MNVQFETPENVLVSYRLAGFGSRFIAYLLDQLVLLVALLAAVAAALVLTYSQAPEWGERLTRGATGEPGFFVTFVLIALGSLTLVNAAAYGLMELLLRGRTIGKKVMGLRVVKANGFRLDFTAVLLRNVARLVDLALLLPPLMLPTLFVAFATDKRQRLGDLLAGTLVVHDDLPTPRNLLELRADLERRPAAAAKFAFDAYAISRVPAPWVEAAEQALSRFHSLKPRDRYRLRKDYFAPLASRLRVEPPAPDDEARFLADFLSAVYRGEYRKLG